MVSRNHKNCSKIVLNCLDRDMLHTDRYVVCVRRLGRNAYRCQQAMNDVTSKVSTVASTPRYVLDLHPFSKRLFLGRRSGFVPKEKRRRPFVSACRLGHARRACEDNLWSKTHTRYVHARAVGVDQNVRAQTTFSCKADGVVDVPPTCPRALQSMSLRIP